MEKKHSWLSPPASVAIALVAVGIVAVLFFVGSLRVECFETYVKLSTSYGAEEVLSYSSIDAVAYRTDFQVGDRIAGVGTAKLSVGKYRNEELGNYTLYAYAGAKEFTVLSCGSRTIVIGLGSPSDTRAVYDTILNRLQCAPG